MKRFSGVVITALLLIFASCSKKTGNVTLETASSQEQFTAAGGSRDIVVTANSTWTVSDTSAWCLASPSSGTGNGTFQLLIQPNPGSISRTTTMVISSGNIIRELLISQAGREPNPEPQAPADSIAPDATGMRDISSVALAREMGVGWNLGNSLDAIGGETAWGNPMVSRQLIDSVKRAGFNAVRIPVAWSRFSDAETFRIDTIWMKRVEEVVGYVLSNNMYAIINIHWDNGWIQPTAARRDYVNNRLAAMWKQIAIRFRDHGDHLLFAGTNEVMVEGDYGPPTQEYADAQNSFNQTFVNTVRATGGRNAYRNLVVQGFNTNIDYTVDFFRLPSDNIDKRLMVEVHYYDPYNFTLNENDAITQWGDDAADPSKTETWANEEYLIKQFVKMKNNFADKGYPVILGEYGAVARLQLGSEMLNREHAAYRKYYTETVTRAALDHEFVPFYWDNGYPGNHGSAIFDRQTGAVKYPEILQALTGK